MNDTDFIRQFEQFADRGLQAVEVRACVVNFVREHGRNPTKVEIVKEVESYLQWRSIEREISRGNIVIEIHLTDKGKAESPIQYMVNNLFKGRG